MTIMVTAMTLVKIPNTNWLSGGGEYIDQLVFKRLIRRNNRCLYIKGYNQSIYEERDKEYLKSQKEKEENELLIG